MKATIQKTNKYKNKYDNEYFDVTINGITHENLEKSDIRHLIQILDNAIHQ